MAEAADRLRAAGLARAEGEAARLVQRASGLDGADYLLGLDRPVPCRAGAHLEAMVRRRLAGEPLQYVVAQWGFRSLDLLLDQRVLIPRPETEQVAEVAIAELRRLGRDRLTVTAVDLGTGSGAIGLSLAVEVATARVWATDRSAAALAVARANLAGIGRPATRVRLIRGDWFGALPEEMRAGVDLIVANPPYVASGDALLPEVADWEPAEALMAGPSGLEAIERIVAGAPAWLARPGVLVLEVAAHQARAVTALAARAGLEEVEVRPDLAGQERVVVARAWS
ncbi:MAG: peptide chain release factor N(5)-glutamine methyltransferase [Acidimicrobiales bacterium]